MSSADGALHDRPGEQALRAGCDEVGAGGDAAAALPEHGHVRRVAAEGGGVALHEPQGLLLVGQSLGARGLVHTRQGEEPHRAEPVVDRDHDDGDPAGELGGVIQGPGAGLQRAAVDPHHHRSLPARSRRRGGCGDVEVEAVLLERGRRELFRVLHTRRTGPRGIAHPIGRWQSPRRRPAQVTDRRLGLRAPR